MTLTLRPYQRDAVEAVATWRRERPREDGVVVLPTGAGKTAVIGELARREVAVGGRVLQLVHRKELLEQNARTTGAMLGTDVGVFAAMLGRKDTGEAVTVASVQSLCRDPYAIGPVSLVLVDEAHLVPTDRTTAYRTVLSAQRRLRGDVAIVGLTATPYRLGSGLLWGPRGALFHGCAYEATIPDLLAGNFLSLVRPRAGNELLDVDGVAVRHGDYVAAELAARVDLDEKTRAIVGECVTSFADRRHWLVFAVSVAHAEHLAEAFRSAGITADAITGSLPAGERAARLAAFTSGATRCAVSCDLLTTGFDFPGIDAIAMVRPTQSPGLYYQMVGRGFRRASNKLDCLVLDFAGNALRHGPVDTLADVLMGRTSAPASGVPRGKMCPACRALVGASATECSACGTAFPPPDRLARVGVVPSDAPLLARAAAGKWCSVSAIGWRRDQGDPTHALHFVYKNRVDKVVGIEPLRFGESGWRGRRIREWWRDRELPGDVPYDAEDAMGRLYEALCAGVGKLRPKAVRVIDGPRFPIVMETRFE